MLINTQELIFTMSYKCNIRCGHCCFSSGPQAEDVLPFLNQIGYRQDGTPQIPILSEEKVLALIDEAAQIGSIKKIAFSGGEPTLFRDMLMRVIARAKQHGFSTGIVTNASWAKTAKLADHLLIPLCTAGLDQLRISYSDYHAEFVPITSIRNCYEAALRLGLEIGFSVVLRKHSRITRAYLQEQLPIQEEMIGKRVFFYEGDVIRTGRGAKLNEADFVSSAPGNLPPSGCPRVGTAPAVTPDGKLVACCGPPHREIPELELGNLHQHSLQDLVHDMSQYTLLHWLRAKGPYGILKTIHPTVGPPSRNICHDCKLLFTDPVNRERLTAYVEQHSAEEIFLNQILPKNNPYETLHNLIASIP